MPNNDEFQIKAIKKCNDGLQRDVEELNKEIFTLNLVINSLKKENERLNKFLDRLG